MFVAHYFFKFNLTTSYHHVTLLCKQNNIFVTILYKRTKNLCDFNINYHLTHRGVNYMPMVLFKEFDIGNTK